MKTKLLILTLFTTLLQADVNMAWVDQKIDEIKPQRSGLNSAKLAALKSPFIIVIEEEKDGKSSGAKKGSSSRSKFPVKKDMSGAPLTLQVVLNNTAMINNKWYKENETVRGYKLIQIKSGHVVLERRNKKIKLFIAQKNKKLNISTK